MEISKHTLKAIIWTFTPTNLRLITYNLKDQKQELPFLREKCEERKYPAMTDNVCDLYIRSEHSRTASRLKWRSQSQQLQTVRLSTLNTVNL
jgi:hypothetical protein